MIRRTNKLRMLLALERLVDCVSMVPSSSVALRSSARQLEGQFFMYTITIGEDDSDVEETWDEAEDAQPENFRMRVKFDEMAQLEPGMIVCIRDGSNQYVQILNCYPTQRKIFFYECCPKGSARLEGFDYLRDKIWVSAPPMKRKFIRKTFTSYYDHNRFHPLRIP